MRDALVPLAFAAAFVVGLVSTTSAVPAPPQAGSQPSAEPASVSQVGTLVLDDLAPLPAGPPPAPVPPPLPSVAPQPPAVATSLALRVPVLMYHYISDVPANQATDRFAIDLRVPPALFEQHLAHLKANGYQTITTPMLWEALNGRASMPARSVILTFDDGYADAFVNALPLLRKYGFRGTFFITVNLVGRPGYLTWDQIRALDQAGMDVESHAMDHKPMTAFTFAGLGYEMGTARQVLATELGHDVRFFAYPSGNYDANAMAAAAANGYYGAFRKDGGSLQSRDWAAALRRTRVTGYSSVDAFIRALSF